MNVIDSYLDTLFAPYQESARLREARAELHAMMEDKQQGLIEDGLTESQAVGQVIAEFGTLEEVAPVLGIDAELGRAAAAPAAPPAALLELDRARAYVSAVRGSQWMPATGLAMFVLCAAPLLLLIAATPGSQGEPGGWAIGIGLTAVLVMVSLGLLLMMARGARLSDFEDIEEGDFTLTAQVRSFAREVKHESRRATILATAVAITLWILSALPTLLTALLIDGDSSAVLYGVSGTLVIVALGLALIARAGWADSATSTLLQETEDDSLEHSQNPLVRVIAVVYWPVMFAVYLIWSFVSGDWGLTWVIWPVAGVLYGALSGLNVALRGDEGSRQQHRSR